MLMNRMDPIEFSRHLRRSANSYESAMWRMLRNQQRCHMKFRRQQPLGAYTADFFCAEARLVIEIDGSPHLTEEGKRYDAARDRWMATQGIRVLRFMGKQVDLDLRSVCSEIDNTIREIIEKQTQADPQPD